MDNSKLEAITRRAALRWAGTLDLLAQQEAQDQADATEYAERYMRGPGRGMTDANRATIARLRDR